jgi:hypothetical protein
MIGPRYDLCFCKKKKKRVGGYKLFVAMIGQDFILIFNIKEKNGCTCLI